MADEMVPPEQDEARSGAEASSAEPSSVAPDRAPTADDHVSASDLACLQAAVDDWQHERTDVIRQLERAQVQAESAERRLVEALGQLDAARRSAHAVRARLEAEVQSAHKRAEQAEKAVERSSAVAEELRVANVELTTAVEAAQWRLSNLETERAALEEEIARLQREHGAGAERLAALETQVLELQRAHEIDPSAAEPASAFADLNQSLRVELSASEEARAAAAAQLNALREEHGRDRATFEAARERNEEQCRAIAALQAELERQRAALSERIAALEADRDAALGLSADVERQLQIAQAAQAQERAAFATEAERREQEQRQAIEALQVEHEAQRAALSERIAALEADRDAALGLSADVERQLQAAQAAQAQERAAFATEAERREQEQRQAIEALQVDRETERAALSERITVLQADRDTAVRQCAELEARLAVAVAEHHATQTGQRTQFDTERTDLLGRLSALEEEVQNRDRQVSELNDQLQTAVQEYEAKQLAATEETRRRETEWQAAFEARQLEIAAVRQAADEAQALLATAQARTAELQEQLTAHAAENKALETGAQAAAELARQQAEALSAAEQREGRLLYQTAELGRRIEELESQNAAYLISESETAAQVEALKDERVALRLRIEQLSTLAAQLERECERVRTERLPVEDARRLQTENARLAARIGEIERQHSEAAHHHSAAVAGYMVELNQRGEAAQERERELQRVTSELELMRQACEDAMTQLAAGREERENLQRQLTELRAAASGSARPTTQAGRTATAPTSPEARAAANTVGKATSQPAKQNGPLTVLHLEPNKAFRDAVSDLVGAIPSARYVNASEAERPPGEVAHVLLVNLLNRTPDPLAAIAAAAAGTDPQQLLAYCADGAHGVLFGTVDFVAGSLGADTCVTRLLQSRGPVQRLLAVSENIELMGTFRAALARVRCSTSVALDLRQVVDLLTMIDPEVLLIDLALPGGDALRLLSRLRADPKTRALPVALLLSPSLNANDFRQHAMRAVREQRLSPADLAEALRQQIGIAAQDSTFAAAKTA